MATSGITVNELSRDDLINASLRKLVVLGLGQTADATQLTNGAQALNAIVSELAGMGMPLWKRLDYTLTLTPGTNSYTFGVGQTVNVAYPLHLYQARTQTSPSFETEIECNIMSFMDFNLLPSSSEGTVVNVNYQPKVNLGVLRVWPTPTVADQLVVTYQAPFDVFTAGANTPDFPQEFNQAIIYQLALAQADEYGVPEGKKGWLEKQAEKHLQIALANGTEDASIYFQPERH